MNRAFIATALAAGLAGVLGTLIVLKWSGDDAAAPLPDHDLPVDAAGVEAQPVATSTAGLRTASGPGALIDAMTSTAGDAEREARVRRDMADLDRSFREQPIDPAWSASTEQALRETMTSDMMVVSEIAPSRLDFSCRSSMCKIEGDFPRYADAADWGIMLITAAGSTFRNARPSVTRNPDGTARLEMYAARP